ncbi:Peroxisomal membrane protein pex16 [Agyrium rufum]|nr:Peroxisomal membrane protein pex16 [Agyrium rufum]
MASLYKQAKKAIPETVSLPPRLLTLYDDFVVHNASSIGQIESGLRSLTYIIPGRFRDAEIASESLHTTIQLLSLYHTSILHRSAPSAQWQAKFPSPDPHTRYTKFWTSHSRLYKRAAVFLQTIQYTELLCEMGAKRRGEKVRWRVVVVLELLKALCRLVIMIGTGQRSTLTPALPERQPIDVAEPDGSSSATENWDGMTMEGEEKDQDPVTWTMPRTGLTLPTLPDASAVTSYLLSQTLTAEDIRSPRLLLRKLSTKQSQIAEITWILRPVLYALLMQRYQNNKKSWTPWLIGLSVELAARQLAKRDMEKRVSGWRGMTGLEAEELRRRGWGMGWWMMRGAFYEAFTKNVIHGVAGKLRGKLLLDLLGGVIEDYDYLWEGYYFSTSSM